MKIDRLLSILIYLLNRDRVSARELAERYEVSVRTIHRDMDALTFAGIPVTSTQGAQGGFGILKSYKLDRQLVDTDDLFFMLTALESIGTACQNEAISETTEKIKSLVRDYQVREIDKRKEKLFLDFSDISIGAHGGRVFRDLDQAIENNRLIRFKYTDSLYNESQRELEPMTIAFKWFSWYLFGYCRLRNDYRLFRLSRIQELEVTNIRFERREGSFSEYGLHFSSVAFREITLKFDAAMKIQIKDYFRGGDMEEDDAGDLIVTTRMPENEGMYSMILSYGDRVEVLAPEDIRRNLQKKCQQIAEKYGCRDKT